MGAGYHGGFGDTSGSGKRLLIPYNLQFFASKVFDAGGRITEKTFSVHGSFFLGKSVKRIQKELSKQGYITHVEKSRHANSKAKRIIVENNSLVKNITVIQVSPGSRRHGDTAYVKVSTSDSGIMKIVSDATKYRTDGKEKAKIFFARRK